MGKIITLSFDDGGGNDKPIAELMLKYKIKGTFYLNFLKHWPRITALPDFYKDFPEEKLEIGSHGLVHDDLRKIDDETLKKYVDRKPYNDFLGREIKTFAPPWGYTNDKVITAIKNAGYIGSRSTILDPTYSYSKDLFQTTITYQTNTIPRFLDFKEKLDNFLKSEGEVFHMISHSWMLKKFDNFKDICKYIHHSGVKCLTNLEVLKMIK